MQDKSVIEQFLQLRPDEQVAVAQHLPTSDVVNYALRVIVKCGVQH